MPPRLRLTAAEAERLPKLLEQLPRYRADFPDDASATAQAAWIRDRYGGGEPLSLNLITLLLFEHGVHRSLDQVTRDLAILREES